MLKIIGIFRKRLKKIEQKLLGVIVERLQNLKYQKTQKSRIFGEDIYWKKSTSRATLRELKNKNKTEKPWFLLCSPVFIPQIAGGVADPPGFVTENMSVAHWLASVAASPASM